MDRTFSLSKGAVNHAYHFLPQVSKKVPTAIAVQWDNYKHVNPMTGTQVTIRELYDFAKNDLKVDSTFWCTQEPYFSKNLIPFLKGIGVRSTLALV